MFPRFVREKMARDDLDVLEAVAERGERDREDVEAVVQILAKLAAGDDLLEEWARRRDDPAFDRDLLEAAEAPHLARLQRAQQLRLEHARQVVDFVEEQRPRPGRARGGPACARAPR